MPMLRNWPIVLRCKTVPGPTAGAFHAPRPSVRTDVTSRSSRRLAELAGRCLRLSALLGRGRQQLAERRVVGRDLKVPSVDGPVTTAVGPIRGVGTTLAS